MKFIKFLLRLVASLLLSLLLIIPVFKLFKPIYFAKSLVIPYAIYPFDICKLKPVAWHYIKLIHFITFFYVCFLFSNSLIKLIFKNKRFKFIHKKNPYMNLKKGFNLYIGKTAINSFPVYLPESSLYQNMLVTGTIGSGKTSSSMYPFVKQLIEYNCNNYNKFGMLILDVKGNFFKQVLKYTREFNRLDDLYVIELGGKFKYNPLDKPNLKPAVLANRLKTVLTLFFPNNTESYWLDKAEEVLTECIKLCRLYNDGYVTFQEIHKLVNSPNYYSEKIGFLRNLFKSRSLRYI